jgi:hypothetical protein
VLERSCKEETPALRPGRSPCEIPVPLVSESVWANAGTAAVQRTISANQTLTFRSLNSELSKFRPKAHFGLKSFGDDCVPSGSRSL